MTERKNNGPASGLIREAVKGGVSGALVLAVMLWLAGPPAQATVETLLPERDITISGKVVAPSCQASLDTRAVSFTRRPDRVRKVQAAGNTPDADTQHLQLQLSECDFDGLGMTFKADTVPGYPERGALRGKVDSAFSTDSYYTLGPVEEEYNGRPIYSLSDDSAQMVKGDGEERYFLLNEQTYWLDINASLSGGEIMKIPFDVKIHSTESGEGSKDDMEGYFTLQLSWR